MSPESGRSVEADLEEMRALSPKRGPRCDACIVLDSMTDADRASVEAGMRSDSVAAIGILEWMRARGYTLSVEDKLGVIRRHGKYHLPDE